MCVFCDRNYSTVNILQNPKTVFNLVYTNSCYAFVQKYSVTKHQFIVIRNTVIIKDKW